MKKSIHSLCALLAISAFAIAARAQPAVKIAVVDLGKLFENHYQTAEYSSKLNSDKQQAQTDLEKMQKEQDALVEEYKNLQEQSSNAALTAEAKSKAQNDAQKKLDEIQAKRNDMQKFYQDTSSGIQSRIQSFRSMMLEQLTKIATDVAKRHGATIVLDKGALIYFDSGFDITDEVMKEINKDRPAGAAAPAASSSSSSSAAPAGPTINLPIAPKK